MDAKTWKPAVLLEMPTSFQGIQCKMAVTSVVRMEESLQLSGKLMFKQDGEWVSIMDTTRLLAVERFQQLGYRWLV